MVERVVSGQMERDLYSQNASKYDILGNIWAQMRL